MLLSTCVRQTNNFLFCKYSYFSCILQAFAKYTEGSIKEIVDPSMNEVVDTSVLEKMFDLAIQCVAPTGADRPDMNLVVEHLWGIRSDYIRSRTKD